MTPAEASRLLKKAKEIDNKIGDADEDRAATWAELLGDVPFELAAMALMEHYRTSTETFMPAHIRPMLGRLLEQHRLEGRRAAAIERSRFPAIEGTSTISLSDREKAELARQRQHSPRVAKELAELRAKLAPGKPGALAISGSMASPSSRPLRASEQEELRRAAARSRPPQAMGNLLDMVTQRVQPQVLEVDSGAA